MGLENVIKKFVTEPFVWVCLAMVGVVLMGPAVANLARKAVGLGRDRGNVAEHSVSINQVLPVSPARQSSDQMASSAQSAVRQDPVEFRSLPSAPREKSQETRELYGSTNDSSQTAIDSRTTLRRDQQELLDTIEKSEDIDSTLMPDAPYQDSAMDKPTVQQPIEKMQGVDFFDVDKMVADVKPETNSNLSAHDFPSGSGTKNLQPADDSVAADTRAAINRFNERESDSVNSSRKDVDLPEAVAAEVASEANSIREDLLPEADTSPLSKEAMLEPSGESRIADATSAAAPESSVDTPQSDAADNNFAQAAEPERDGLTGDQTGMSDEESVFSPWDEPLEFQPKPDKNNAAKDFATEMNQTPPRDSIPSIAPESGGTWWDAMIAQQFWPERQAQFASIDSVVFMALQNSAQIQILNDRPHIEETFVQQREADFDWSAFVDASWNSINEPVRSELQTGSRAGRFEQDELSVSSGLQKRLGRGGELRVGSSIGTLDNNSIFLAPPDQGTATFSLDYRQPLLRGRGREISQSQIVLAQLNVETSKHAVKQQMQEYLVDVVTAYWDLYRARGVLSQRHRNHMRATEIVGRLSAGSSGAAQVQLQRAQATAGARHSEVIDAEYMVADAQERLMNLTHGGNLIKSNEIEIIPTDATPHSYLPHDLGYITQLAVQNRAEVKEVLAQIKAASVRQVIALDGLKPRLDAIISSYVAGVRGSRDVGNAITDQFSAGDPSYAVGMSFEIPIGRRSANAGTRREAIRRRVLENKLRKTLGDVSVSARTAFRDVYRLIAITDNNRQVVVQSANALNSIQRDIGWLQKEDPSVALFVNDLLMSQDRLAEAEQNLLDSQAQLAIAYVRLKRATGELLRDSAGTVESQSCSTCGCGEPECDCSNVSQATWHEPIEQINNVIEHGVENGKEFIHDVRERIQPSLSREPKTNTFDVPLEQPTTRPGVSPLPVDADTAGEIFHAPIRYPLSTQRPSDWGPSRY